MRIILKLKENPYSFMRRCGYHPEGRNKKGDELIFAKRIGYSDYPRFHVYLKFNEISRQTIINLHLDQKKPLYKNAPAHGGEYTGSVVEKEVERIKQIAGR